MKNIFLNVTVFLLLIINTMNAQCTFSLGITSSGPLSFCEGDSVVLTSNAVGNVWVQKNNFAGVARSEAVTFSIGDKTYITTGTGANGRLKDLWEYDPTTDTWSQKANFGGTARQNAVGFSINNFGYVGTGLDIGNNGNDDFWQYDPTTNTWLQKANFPGGTRELCVGFALGGKGYLGTSALTKDMWEYNPTNDTWTQKNDIGIYARYGSFSFVIGNKAYIGGGKYYSSGFGGEIYEYNQSIDQWDLKTTIPITYRNELVGVFTIGNKAYIGTGRDPLGSPSRSVFCEYDPTANTWTSKPDFQGGERWGIGAFSNGNQGFFLCGKDFLTNKKDVWEYKPSIVSYNWSSGQTTNSVVIKNGGVYTLSVTNSAGCQGTSTVSVTVNQCIGIKENNSTKNKTIYFHNNCLHIKEQPYTNIEIYGMDGVHKKSIGKEISYPSVINLSDLGPGYYIYRYNVTSEKIFIEK